VKLTASLVLVIAACSKKPEPAGTPPPAAPSEAAVVVADAAAIDVSRIELDAAVIDTGPPEERARAVLDQQLATFPHTNDDAMVATFAPGAFALTPRVYEVKPGLDLAEKAGYLQGYAELRLKGTETKQLVVGGRGATIWFVAEVEIRLDDQRYPIRIVELLDGNQQWRPVVASFGIISPAMPRGGTSQLQGATDAGPLAKFLTSPVDASAALADDPDVVVMGTDRNEYAVGTKAAKALLARWSKLKLYLDGGLVREVRTKDWGYAIANVNYDDPQYEKSPMRMSALVIALPDGAAWKIVALHYLPW
jgi:hypothetical protein